MTPALPAPLVLELIAAVLAGGASPASALRAVGAVLADAGDPRGRQLLLVAAELDHPAAGSLAGAPDEGPPGEGSRARPVGGRLAWSPGRAVDEVVDEAIDEVVDEAVAVAAQEMALAVTAGLPPAALLRRAAQEQRRRSAAAQRRAVQRLEVFIVLPAALCLLPAFVLMGVVPLVLALVRG